MPAVIECTDGFTFAQSLTARGAWFYIYGRGREAVPIYPDNHPESKRLVKLAKERRYRLVGMLGLKPDGTLLVIQTKIPGDRDLGALLAGAAFAADAVAGTSFPEPKPLKPADEAEVNQLEALFALEDTRTEGGDHA